MINELAAELGSLLYDPIDRIKPSLMSTVRDCEEPHSDRKRECTEIRCRMMSVLTDLGYGDHSILSMMEAVSGGPQENDGRAPKSKSSQVSAASKAAFWAIMTRNELLKPEEDTREFDRQLNLIVSQADAVLGDPRSTYEFDLPDDALIEAIQKLSGRRRSDEALQSGAKKKQEKEAPLISERNKHIRELGKMVSSEPGHHSRIAGKVTVRYNIYDYLNFPPRQRLDPKTIRKILREHPPVIPLAKSAR